MRSTIQLMLKRTIANWRLLSAVIIGSILAGTIMSATVVYFESLRDIALQKELHDQNPADLDILIEAGPDADQRRYSRRIDFIYGVAAAHTRRQIHD